MKVVGGGRVLVFDGNSVADYDYIHFLADRPLTQEDLDEGVDFYTGGFHTGGEWQFNTNSAIGIIINPNGDLSRPWGSDGVTRRIVEPFEGINSIGREDGVYDVFLSERREGTFSITGDSIEFVWEDTTRGQRGIEVTTFTQTPNTITLDTWWQFVRVE